jgi:hypothetical protein
MTFFISVVVFIIILFMYIHISGEYKKSQDMEIYELDFVSNQNLQSVCDSNQPVILNLMNVVPEFFKHMTLKKFLTMASSHPVMIKDIEDYNNTSKSSVDCIALPFKTALKLFDSDTKSRFFSDSNTEFTEESGISVDMMDLDEYIKPAQTIQRKYDILFGSNDAHTPLRYTTSSRQFIVVSSGRIMVKMTPFKSTKYLHVVRDYENYEFRSEIDVWSPQPQFTDDWERVKFIEFDVTEGNVLYIPAYWWYSIKYCNNDETCLLGYTYNTIMNRIANIPDIVRHVVRMQNTVVKISKDKTSDVQDEESQEIPPDTDSSYESTNLDDNSANTPTMLEN